MSVSVVAWLPSVPVMAATASPDGLPLMERVTELCLYLPVGLTLAVILMEMFAGGKRHPESDKASAMLLVVASVLAFINAFIAFSQRVDTTGPPKAAGISALMGIVCAVAAILKQQWNMKRLVEMARVRVKSKLAPRRGRQNSQTAMVATLYFVVLLGAIAGTSITAVVRPGLELESPAVAGGEPAVKGAPGSAAGAPVATGTRPAAAPPKPEPTVLPREPEIAVSEISPVDSAPSGEVDVTEPDDEAPLDDNGEPVVAMNEGGDEGEPALDPATAVPVAKTSPPPARAAVSDEETEAAVRAFKTQIVSIFRRSCYECHGSSKQKGGLRLDSPDAIRKGGDSGPVIKPGDPDRSHLYAFITLPDGDPDIMPAKGQRLSQRESEWIRKWIEFGAPMGDGNDLPVVAASTDSGDGDLVDSGLGVPATVMKQIMESHVQVRADRAGVKGMLEVDCSYVRNYGDVDLDLGILTPIAERIGALDLTSTKIVDEDLAHVAKMPNLTQLLLNRTGVGDQGMKHLAGLTKLTLLNLYETDVSDAGLQHFVDLKNLKKLYLWNSKATRAGADALKAKLPDVTINIGG